MGVPFIQADLQKQGKTRITGAQDEQRQNTDAPTKVRGKLTQYIQTGNDPESGNTWANTWDNFMGDETEENKTTQ